jgi:hypothetical protein
MITSRFIRGSGNSSPWFVIAPSILGKENHNETLNVAG